MSSRAKKKSSAPEPLSGGSRGKDRGAAAARTRRALLDAAAALFAERGLDAPSLDGICERAGFTRGAFYVHFRDREELIAAVAERTFARFVDGLMSGGAAALDLASLIRGFALLAASGGFPVPGQVPFSRLLEACERSPEARAKLLELAEDVRARVEAVAVRAHAEGQLRADVDPRVLAHLLFGLVLGLGAAVELGLPHRPLDVAELVLALVDPGG